MCEKSKKLSPEEKQWAVKEYLSGKGSPYSIAAKYGVTDTSIRRWVDRYEIEGEQAFRRMPLQLSLSQSEKLCDVHEYLDGALSLRNVALKYGVGETSVRKWIAKYNAGGDATKLRIASFSSQVGMDYFLFKGGAIMLLCMVGKKCESCQIKKFVFYGHIPNN